MPRPSQEGGPDTKVHEHLTVSKSFRAANLQQARSILADEVPYLLCLPLKEMWISYPVDESDLKKAKKSLIQQGLLSDEQKWSPTVIREENFNSRINGSNETRVFQVFSHIFNVIMSSLASGDKQMPGCVDRMVHAGSIEPKSDRQSSHRPDAFLIAHSQTSPKPTESEMRWRDVTCPFEYKFGNGDATDNDVKALWSLHHIMRSDPRRIFSFGVTVRGTAFTIWLLCRAAPFLFDPFDWFKDPDSLIRFFVLLATSSATDLGFDTTIKRVGPGDFNLQYDIEGSKYNFSRLLYDIGADAPCGRGTWVFEVKIEGENEARVLKDCWVENREGKQMEHEIVAGIRETMKHDDFHRHFVNICGHLKTETSGWFREFCNILNEGTFEAKDNFRPQALILIRPNSKSIYDPMSTGGSVPNQNRHPDMLAPTTRPAPEVPPHSRFRYQVVYQEEGTTLYGVTSLEKAFKYLGQTVDAAQCLHEAGWVHRDLSPGNVIVVGDVAKISDLEFAKKRAARDLETLTRSDGLPKLNASDTRTGTLLFTAIEVQLGAYEFRQPGKKPLRPLDGGSSTDHRIFLYNPLHDYESIWWMAVWFVFNSKIDLNGSTRSASDSLQETLHKNRSGTFRSPGLFQQACKRLPAELEDICLWLDWMRETLCSAYHEFEMTFDGSDMLSVVADLREGLERIEGLARNVNTALPEVRMNRTRNEADQVVQCLEIREELLVDDGVEGMSSDDKMEELPVDCMVGSGGGPSSPGDDLFISGPPTAEPGTEFVLHSNKRIRDPESPDLRDPSRAAKYRIKLPDGP
ncbi:hypothetical protein BJ322DRAFT_1066990 [Thelephora terrestris]|uniref:Fungal-type protein kinase domain-containing protein n=1 Tax=Thelephora terrestris TaxID=56493 RepID=A0A9P6HC43_9AGAM|nr:hypothetical protein BJ322DRAFT_1066990 [Thelephora terrestris]